MEEISIYLTVLVISSFEWSILEEINNNKKMGRKEGSKEGLPGQLSGRGKRYPDRMAVIASELLIPG